jgi:uncharacterized phage-associated protein
MRRLPVFENVDRWAANPAAPRPLPDKVREAILHVIDMADKTGTEATQYDILKTLFFADRSHLNRYGRPVTFDQYYALKDGPAPSLGYDILKDDAAALEAAGLQKPLWVSENVRGTVCRFSKAARPASEDILSESDMDELEAAFQLVKKLGFKGVWDKTHRDPAYDLAWEQRGTAKRAPMRYEDLLDEPNPRLIRELAFASKSL